MVEGLTPEVSHHRGSGVVGVDGGGSGGGDSSVGGDGVGV